MLRKINLRRDRWAYPPQRSLLRSAEVGHPGWVFSISCQQYWFENSIWSVRLITLRFVIRLFVTPSTTREQELPYSYDGGEAAVNGGFHAWRWGRWVVFSNSGVHGPAIRLVRDIALTLVTRRYEEPSDPSGRAQAAASRDWIYSRMGRNHTRGSNLYRIRFLILGSEQWARVRPWRMYRRPCGFPDRSGSALYSHRANIIRQPGAAHA